MSVLTKTPVVPSFSTFPANPYLGQRFLHVLAGRNYDYEYNGAGIWVPKSSIGPLTLYADPVNGVDDQNHGFGAGANAYRTLQYTWNQIPPVIAGAIAANPVVVNLGPGTFSEDLWLTGKGKQNGAYNYSVQFFGTQNTVVAAGVATGGTIGNAAGHPTVTGAFAANAYNGKIIEFTSGANNGIKRVIGLTTVTTLWLEGDPLPAAPVNNDTYRIYDWATIINGSACHNTVTDTGTILFRDIEFSAAAPGAGISLVLTVWGGGKVYMNYCKVNHDGQTFALWIGAQGFIFQEGCFNIENVGGGVGMIETEAGGYFEGHQIKAIRTPAAGGNAFYARLGSSMDIYSGCEISGFNYGVFSENHSEVFFDTSQCRNYIHGCANVGVESIAHSHVYVAGQNTYGVKLDGTADINIANESAHAASFSYIWA